MAHFLRTKHPLLDQSGRLSEAGYSTSLVLDYDRRSIKANALRIKEWDYYFITDGCIGIALTVADNSYMGFSSISFLNFEKKLEITKSATTLFPMGKTNLPSSSEYGDLRISKKNYELFFENHGNKRILTFRMERFTDQAPISGRLTLTCPPGDSMVIATPFPGAPKAFYYNQKINCMPAEGTITLGDKRYSFAPGAAMAVLDWGRGLWTYKNTWYWSSASGKLDGVPFGFNFGYGFGDLSAATENMLFYNRAAHKLDQVTFEIPKKNGKYQYMEPWRIADNNDRLALDFIPVLDRSSRTDLKFLCSDQHQVFGRFSGKATLDNGKTLILRDFFGFAERVYNKW